MKEKKWKLLLWLVGINLFISTFTFGGGYIVVPMVRKYFVARRKLFSEERLMSMAAVAQSSPGAIAINLSALAGLEAGGMAGLVVSVTAALLPPLVVISLVSIWYTAFSQNLIIAVVLKGMLAGAAAVIVDFIVDMANVITKENSRLLTFLMPTVFIAGFFFQIHAVLLLVLSFILCLLNVYIRKKKGEII